MNEFPRVVTRLLRGALLFFPVLWGLFWLSTPYGIWGSMYLAALVELLPALAIAQLPLVAEEEPLPRVPVYISSAALILFLGWVALLVGRREMGLSAMGLQPIPFALLAVWTAGIMVAAVLLLLGFFWFRKAAGIPEAPLLRQLLPRTGSERVLFVFLSISAGLGEELAYRGFLVPVLAQLLGGPWPAALLSSALFGVLHAYQGWLGVMRTACLGLVLASSFIVTGVLWPAILAHAMLDILAGLVLGDLLVRE